MVAVTTPWETVLKGQGIEKVEDHWSRQNMGRPLLFTILCRKMPHLHTNFYMPYIVLFQINLGTFSTVCFSLQSDSVLLWYLYLMICTTVNDQSFIETIEERPRHNRIETILWAHNSYSTNDSWTNVCVNGWVNAWMKYVCAFQPFSSTPLAQRCTRYLRVIGWDGPQGVQCRLSKSSFVWTPQTGRHKMTASL